jgi:hypothetical protein
MAFPFFAVFGFKTNFLRKYSENVDKVQWWTKDFEIIFILSRNYRFFGNIKFKLLNTTGLSQQFKFDRVK